MYELKRKPHGNTTCVFLTWMDSAPLSPLVPHYRHTKWIVPQISSWDAQNPPSTTPIQLFYSHYPFTLVHAHKEHTCWEMKYYEIATVTASNP